MIELDNNIFGGITSFPVPLLLLFYVRARTRTHTHTLTQALLQIEFSFRHSIIVWLSTQTIDINTHTHTPMQKEKRENNIILLLFKPPSTLQNISHLLKILNFRENSIKLLCCVCVCVLNVEFYHFIDFCSPRTVDSVNKSITPKNCRSEYLLLHKLFFPKHLGSKLALASKRRYFCNIHIQTLKICRCRRQENGVENMCILWHKLPEDATHKLVAKYPFI